MKRNFVNPLFASVKVLSPFVLLSLTALGVTTLFLAETQSSVAEVRLVAQAKPLARELQGKPVVVDIYASWCSKCTKIAPTMSSLKKQYDGKAHFIVFDVTDRNTTQTAEAKARQLGLNDFLGANKSQTGLVAIIDPANGKVLQQFRGNPRESDYTTVLNAAIARMSKK